MGFEFKQTSGEGADWVVVPTGEYLGQITKVEEDVGKFGPTLKFFFDIDNQGEVVEIVGWTSQKFSRHPKNKLMQWAKAVFGKPIPEDYNLDTDHLLNKPVTVVVQRLPKLANGEEQFDEEGKQLFTNKVLELQVAPGGATVPPPAPKVPEYEEDQIPF